MSILSAIRLANRSLIRRRTYAATVVIILALGIGANTAIFGLVDAVLLRSLPYSDPESLVVVFADGTARGQGNHLATTPGDFADWQARGASVFEGLAALRNVSPRITSLDTPVVPLTHAVSANYFDVLGAPPMLGRGFLPGEDAPGRGNVVVLSYRLWTAKFGGDRSIVGRSIDLDGRPYAVVGVMARDFYSAHLFNVQPDLWIPAAFAAERDDRVTRDLLVYGRLRPDQSVARAQAAVRAIGARIAADHSDTNDRWSIALLPIRDHAIGAFERIGALVAGAVALVLLIACANVANLMLVRGAERRAELAVRTALGASRARLAMELLAESLVLALAGGAAGIGLAWWIVPVLVHLIPTSAGVPFLFRAAIDARVLGFTIATSFACAIVAGLLPSRQAARADVVTGLRSAARGAVPSTARRWRRGLVAAEVALAIVVIACAALMLRTLAALDRVEPGFQAARIAQLRTSLRGDAFAAPAARVAHFDELQRRLAAIPGVASASAVSFEPPTQGGRSTAVGLRLPGQVDDKAAVPSAVSRPVLPDYFATMGIPIVSGRAIDARDRAASTRVAVISQSMAARYFAGVDPIGRTFSVAAPGAPALQIVGVSGDVMSDGNDPTPQPMFYTPYAQNALPVMTMVMRVPIADPASVLAEAEHIAWSVSTSTNVYAVQTMAQRLADLKWRERFTAAVLTGFAVLGLLLAAAGLYAIVAYAVVQRRCEIGVRIALGATAPRILGEVMRDGLHAVIPGLVIGAGAAAIGTRALAGLLYGVAPADPLTIGGVSVAMLAVAACACAVPAVAASRIDPNVAMRGE